jgi:hypothetical protein
MQFVRCRYQEVILNFKPSCNSSVFFIIFTENIYMKSLIVAVYFQIGVNVIGLPEIIKHDISKCYVSNSKYHR